jgi:hypothetical protein
VPCLATIFGLRTALINVPIAMHSIYQTMKRPRGEAELEAQDLLDSGEGAWGHWTIWMTDEMGRHVTSVLVNDVRKKFYSGSGSEPAARPANPLDCR